VSGFRCQVLLFRFYSGWLDWIGSNRQRGGWVEKEFDGLVEGMFLLKISTKNKAMASSSKSETRISF
jgi:hypothetical protein